MNNDELILAELRKISSWADKQRKLQKWATVIVAVFIPAMVIFGVIMTYLESTREIKAVEKHDWYDVDQNIRACNLSEPMRIDEELIQKTLEYPKGHYQLASAYVAAGKLKEARAHFAEAARLFPCEEYEKMLIAIDKRIATEKSQPDAPANATSPHL